MSLGLTGDSPITRVVGEEFSGLTGDSRTRGQVFQANDTFASNGDVDVDWTWVGLGAGMAALLAAAMGVLYLGAASRPSRTPVATAGHGKETGRVPGDRPVLHAWAVVDRPLVGRSVPGRRSRQPNRDGHV